MIKTISSSTMIVAIWVLLIMSGCGSAKKKAPGRPNILIVMSDNQSWNHAGCYGDKTVRTPNMDRIARQGVQFNNAFCSAPSCTPARAAYLTGQDVWRLKEGADLWSILPVAFTTYTDLLEQGGYKVGFQGKGWGPGSFEANGRKRNPAGDPYKSFNEFLGQTKEDQPWTYWISSVHPHRPYEVGSGAKAGIDPSKVSVPAYLPDHADIRGDIADYYAAVEAYDQELGQALAELQNSGQLENTIIVVCSDNGWQMPRGLANLYDFGTHVPLIISWPGRFKNDITIDNLVTLNDLAPTFLELAQIPVPAEMTGKSLLQVLKGDTAALQRTSVVLGRERHAFVRQHGLGYPGRAIRTKDFLYIKNYNPDRWPAGDPPFYGDIDPYMLNWEGPAKYYMMDVKDAPEGKFFFNLGMGKRPAEEMFDIRKDPGQLHNIANDPQYATLKKQLLHEMTQYLIKTNDPRETNGDTTVWDTAPYFSEIDKTPQPTEANRKRFKLYETYSYLK